MNQNIQSRFALKRSIWDYLFYASLLIISIWLILKVSGVISSPAWLEYGIPVAGAVVTFLTFHYSIMDKIVTLSVNMARSEERLIHVEKDIGILKGDIGVLRNDVEVLKTRIK